jgi:hypothetical protein
MSQSREELFMNFHIPMRSIFAALALATVVGCSNSPASDSQSMGASSSAGSPAVAAKPAADPSLMHRYSFTDGARDSTGHIDGTLKNAAKVSGGKLVLDNAGKTSADPSLAYLDFSAAIIPKSGSVSIVFWFTGSSVDSFARIIDFGDREDVQGRAFIYFTPRASTDMSRAAITADTTGTKTFIDTAPIDDGKPHCVAIVINDGDKKLHLFIDGKEPVAAADLGANTLDKVRPTHSWIGKSGFDQDGALTGSLDELRIYNKALTLQDAAAIDKAGPDQLPTP